MTSVLIVDDHPVYRRGLAALLRASGFEVVGEAASMAEAVEASGRFEPDIVLMDLGLPDGTGTEATERIRAAQPHIRVVVITMYDDDGRVRGALRAGASGYVVKDAPAEEVIAAIEAARMGASLIGSGLNLTMDSPPPVPPSGALAGFGLTPRERQIVDLLGKGLPNRIIAERLGVTTKTVANSLSIVLVKLGASDRAEAVAIIRGHKPA